ncbi:MAG: hypothetical protein KC502_20340 [Myxococcales bacterium]|nr:hypothetical protein [Myxococcales bacterium]
MPAIDQQPDKKPRVPGVAGNNTDTNASNPMSAMGYAMAKAGLSTSGDFVGGPGDEKYTTRQDLADPKLAKDDETKKRETHGYKRKEGNLFHYGVRAQDVMQGWLSNCYFAAALAAVAQRYPNTIKEGIEDRGGGVFGVRFYEVDWRGGASEEWVEVDADFPWIDKKENWAYMQSTQKKELWPGLVEKAYAKFKAGGSGDYNTIGQGGWEGDVMEALTGRPCDYAELAHAPLDRLWQRLKKASDKGQAMTAGTYDDHGKEDARYGDKTRMWGNHAYTVMGVKTKGRGRKKERMVQLRNPWGESEPGQDGTDDGIFWTTLEAFKRDFEALTVLDS